MRRAGFRLLEHTADVRLVTWGPTLADACAEAVRGLIAVTFDPHRIRPRESRHVTARSDDPARALVQLLEEVIFLLDTEGFVSARAAVTTRPDGLDAELLGETLDPARHTRVGPQVKAVTYHQIEVDPGPPGRVQLVLDV